MTPKDSTLTQTRLKELLHYCPETGVFTWIKNKCFKIKAGDTAGSIHSNGSGKKYLHIKIDYNLYRAHRLAVLYMTGFFPSEHTDHEDGNGLNNKWNNLRSVTRSENGKNKRLHKNNKTGCTGISWHKATNKFIAQIGLRVNGERKVAHLGLFNNIFDAACARKSAENKHNFHNNHGAKRVL